MEARAEDLTRRDRNKLRNRTEILEAAVAVFAEKGYHQASIQEIADRADFAVSTLYALFEGKEDLYRQVTVDVAKRCGDIFDRAMDEGSNEYEKLVNFARAKGEAFRESPDGVRMLDNEVFGTLQGVETPSESISQIYDRFMVRIRDLFESGIENGLFVQHDPRLLATSLDSVTNALLRLSRAEPETYAYGERVNEVIDIFFTPVLTGKN